MDPVDVDLWTRPGPRTTLEGDAAAVASQLGGAQGTLSAKLSTMATAFTSRVAGSAGSDLNLAMAAHAGQLPDADPLIGAISVNADGQATTIITLSNEAADAIASAEPPEPPPYVSHPADPEWGIGEGNPPPDPNPTPPPGGTVADLIINYYDKYLRREPSQAEINTWAVLWPNQDAIEHGILYSAENASKVNDLYHQYLDRDVEADELAELRAHKWGLDDVEDDLRQRA